MSRSETISVGVVVAREPTGNPWEEFAWRAVEAVYPAPAEAGWNLMRTTAEATYYYAGTTSLELHRKEAGSYIENVEGAEPALYVVLRRTDEAAVPLKLHLVTASLTDVQAYGEGGDEVVGPVAMPDEVKGLVGAFAADHYVEEAFYKRRRKNYVEEEVLQFGQEPIFERRAREQRRAAKDDEK